MSRERWDHRELPWDEFVVKEETVPARVNETDADRELDGMLDSSVDGERLFSLD